MPFTPHMRRRVDQIRDFLYGGGYPDPVSNAEQLSFMFFFFLVEGMDQENADRARGLKRTYTSIFDGVPWELRNPLNAPSRGEATIPRSRFRWSVWARGMSGAALVTFVRDEVFPFYADVADRSAVNFMHGARLVIDEPTVLAQVVMLIDQLGLEDADADGKGDLFEHIPMNAAALPCRIEDPPDRRFEPFVRIRDYQLHPAQTAARQALEKA